MTVREHTEQNEQAMLSEFASKSAAAVRKDETEPRCDIRTEFQRDRDRIIHCKAFRRLMHKTQVFISPEGDHFRTRLTHTLEVSQIARTISRALRLNEDLTEAIALGHDLGHTPFGHLGEEALDKLMLDGFRHNEQSIRVAEKIEKQGRGLNLTLQVLDGILNHRGNGAPETLEGKVVQISDKIAYINHDIDDALRAGILTKEELPKDCVDILGDSTARRIDFLVRHIVTESFGRPEIVMLAEVRNAMGKLRQYLFENLYLRQGLNERKETSQKLYAIYDYFMRQRQELPKEFLAMIESGESVERVVCDFIACMTDRYAEKLHYNIAGVFDKSLCKNY